MPANNEFLSAIMPHNAPVTHNGRVSPASDGLSHFVYGAMPNAQRGDYRDRLIAPTATLFKPNNAGDTGTMLLVWAFQQPKPVADVEVLAAALGMESADEMIPLPGTDRWELVSVDAAQSATLGELEAAYLANDKTEGTEGGAGGVSEAQPANAAYGDAVCLTPYHEVEYAKPIIVTLGPNREARRWTPKEIPAGAFFAKLCQNVEGSKDGPAFVLADMVPGQRLKTNVKALYGVSLDIDTGTPSARVDAAIKKLGCMAVRYTTHSHNKTKTEIKKDKIVKYAPGQDIDDALIHRFLTEVEKWDKSVVETAEYAGTEHTERGIVCVINHAPMPKHRVVLLFAEPFVIENEAPTQAEAMKKWAKVPEALAGLLGVPFDTSCTDPSRLFYFPRHAKGRPFEISLFGGPFFDWRTLQLDDPYEKLASNLNKGKSKSVSDEGRALGRWSLKRSHGFQIADVIEQFASDRIRHDTGHGLEIECPFDEDHSNSGDPEDRACLVVNAGEGQSEFFTISCRHESCRNKTNLDMLGKMLRDGWFEKDVLESEQFNALVEDDQKPEVALKIEKQDEAKKDYIAAIQALTADAGEPQVKAIIAAMIACGAPKSSIATAINQIIKQTGGTKSVFQKSGLKEFVKEARQEHAEKAKISPDRTSNNLLEGLSKSLGKTFTFPPSHIGDFYLSVVEGKAWIFKRGQSDNPDIRLCTAFVLRGGATFADRGGTRALRVELLNQENSWVTVDIDAGDLATLSAVDALRVLMKAGLALTRQGKLFITDYLTESQPRGPVVYDRPGFRSDGFICPTGEVLLANKAIELSSKTKLDCAATAGSFENWLAGVTDIFRLPIADAFQFQAGVLMGLAGTLANLANDEMLAYAYEGPSSTGKSTSEMLAVAHWCDPKLTAKGLFVSSKGTDNSHEAMLEKGAGTVAALDEIGHLPAKVQQEIMFAAQAGTGKRRLNAQAEERRTRGWKGGALIVSAETGFAQRLRAEGVRQTGGLAVRFTPISTDHVRQLSRAELASVGKVLDNFGWSGPAFVMALRDWGHIAQRHLLKEKVALLVDKLSGTSGSENAYRQRAARHVAYLAAAGLIAQDAGLIPEEFDVLALAEKLWADALKSESGPTDPNERALQHLVDEITARKDSDIVALSVLGDDRRGRKEAVGFYDDLKHLYVIRASKIDELSGGFVSGRAFREFLEKRGYLIKQGNNRTWSGYPSLGKDAQYVVLRMDKIEG